MLKPAHPPVVQPSLPLQGPLLPLAAVCQKWSRGAKVNFCDQIEKELEIAERFESERTSAGWHGVEKDGQKEAHGNKTTALVGGNRSRSPMGRGLVEHVATTTRQRRKCAEDATFARQQASNWLRMDQSHR